MKNLKIVLIALLISCPFWWGINLFQKNLEKFFYAEISQPFEEIVVIQTPAKPKKPPLELNAKSAISLQVDSKGKEKILFQKNLEEILPIASLTKLMTAVIALEDENSDFENILITISKEAANQRNVPNYGNLDREVGKNFTFEQLLNLMLIYSSNDSAFALAEVIGVKNFVQRMNEKSEELGLKNTYFVNPTGLDLENLNDFNYSTAKDLAKLAYYILKNYPLIYEISLKKGDYPTENGLSDLSLPENQKMIGGKTGYTKNAKGSLIFLFEDEKGRIFINVILGAETEKARIEEMQKLINWLNL